MALKKILNYLSTLVICVSIAFLISKLLKNKSLFLDFNISLPHFIIVMMGSFLFVLGCFILSLSWGKLLIFLGEKKAGSNIYIWIYARANIAKYIPGNVFQFAGRHILGLENGFSHSGLGASLLLEMAGLILSASIIGGTGVVAFGIEQNVFNPVWIFVGIPCLGLLTFGCLKTFMPLLKGRFKTLPQTTTKAVLTQLSPIFFFYIIFFLLIGTILIMTVIVVAGPVTLPQASMILTVFSFSWLAGFLTPGSPSGIGIREAIIISLLGVILAESDCIMVAIYFRIITTLGDLFFLIAGYLKRQSIKL